MRKSCAAVGVALVAALPMPTPANAARDGVEPEYTRTSNDGEQGYLALSIPVSLTGTPQEVAGKIAGACEFTTTGVPNTSESVVTAFAHATSTATSAGFPVATGVTCEVTNAHGGVTIDQAAPLAEVAAPGTQRVRYGVLTLCLTVSALYDTNVAVASKRVCARP